MNARTFIGRQPIVDRDRHVVGYELLFRSARDAQVAEIQEVGRAAVRVMVNTFASLGMDAVLGPAQGFFNVNREVLLSDAIEALPSDRVVIEILESVEPAPEVVSRCRALREAGFVLALDDWGPDDPRTPLLPLVDLVKVDLPAVPHGELRRLARTLRREPVRLLAEKVETLEEFQVCSRIGFELFQGYFFARPVVLEGAELDATKTILIEALQRVTAEEPTERIVETFKKDAKLGINLLRLVNTAGRSTRVRLESIEDAVRHLGLQQLARWIAILLYAQGGEADMRSPLLVTAAHRGRLMELLARQERRGTEDGHSERAFLVGMLSLADALLGRPLELLVRELRLADDIALALTHHEGALGSLLDVAEAIERGAVEKFEPEIESRDLDFAGLQRFEDEAYAWVHGLAQTAA